MKLSSICTIGLSLAAVAVSPALVAENPVASTPAQPSIFTMNNSVPAPTAGLTYQPEGVSSSSVDDAIAAGDPASALATERESLGTNGVQPPPGRRSYGRSRYQDKMHNADGSSKIAFVAGAGMTLPAGNTAKFNTVSYAIEAGAGLNFNKMFGVLAEFHYDKMNLTPGAIAYQYNNYQLYSGATASQLVGLDGNSHVIAITLNPIVNFAGADRRSKLGGYVTGGIGYYHKVTNFTLPTEIDTYYYSYITNSTFDSYSAGGFGANIGAGVTYKMSDFGSERLFMEARYHWINLATSNNQDFYPYNRRNTEYIPVTVGIRF
jgi:hypothetical protein